MKRCPKCGEMLMDTTEVCPICGYKFPVLDMDERFVAEREGVKIPVKSGKGNLLFYESMFASEYPPFLEGFVPAIELALKNDSENGITLSFWAGIEKYAYEDKKTITLKPGDTYMYSYFPSFKKEVMGELKSYGKSSLYYVVDGDIEHRIEKKESVTILSYGDILWMIDGMSLAKYIVKWVTPRDELIREKLLNMVMDEMEKLSKSGKIKEFEEYLREAGVEFKKGMIFGEQLGKLGIYVQVWALFNALKKWGIRYKSTTVSILREYQRVRLPREVLKEKGGNCIDLAVTFASALEAMDLVPVIFLIPGHAFPGVMIRSDMVKTARNYRHKGTIIESINSKYESIMKKYGITIEKDKDERESMSVLKSLDDYLIPCCGEYALPVESTMIPDSTFLEAVRNIKKEGKIDKIEEIIVVPVAREELGEAVLPYEDLRLSIERNTEKTTQPFDQSLKVNKFY